MCDKPEAQEFEILQLDGISHKTLYLACVRAYNGMQSPVTNNIVIDHIKFVK